MKEAEVTEMALRRAVSTALPRPPYCLLSEDEAREYDCVETARRLSAEDEDTRLQALWHHHQTHVDAYVRWARNRNRVDATYKNEELRRESARDIVEEALCSFGRRVKEGGYHFRKNRRPCAYVERAITNKAQDRLRKGKHPTKEECALCYQEKGRCKFSGHDPPSEREQRKCFRIPPIDDFDEVCTRLAGAGLLDPPEWPPRPGQELRHSVEELISLEDLMRRELKPIEIRVIILYLEGKSGPEIAREINRTVDNVHQIHHRAIEKLRRAWAQPGDEPMMLPSPA